MKPAVESYTARARQCLKAGHRTVVWVLDGKRRDLCTVCGRSSLSKAAA